MTATARPAADEFFEFYNMNVVVIPPSRDCIRTDDDDTRRNSTPISALVD
jgi:preprotein translocase subunit SecA